MKDAILSSLLVVGIILTVLARLAYTSADNINAKGLILIIAFPIGAVGIILALASLLGLLL